jgi:hypothetical protein
MTCLREGWPLTRSSSNKQLGQTLLFARDPKTRPGPESVDQKPYSKKSLRPLLPPQT